MDWVMLLLPQISLCCLFQINSTYQPSNSDGITLAEYAGWIQSESSVYTGYSPCIREYSQLNYDIRMVGCYESNAAHSGFRQHNPGPLYINLQTCGGQVDNNIPLVLVLNSYENTQWIIDSDDDDVVKHVNLHEILVYAYHTENTTVELGTNLIKASIEVTNGMHVSNGYYGYGKDCRIYVLIDNLNATYGECPYSFIGGYEYETVYLCVGSQHLYGNASCPSSVSSVRCKMLPTSTATSHQTDEYISATEVGLILGIIFVVILVYMGFQYQSKKRNYTDVATENDPEVIKEENITTDHNGEKYHLNLNYDEGVIQDPDPN